MARMNDLLNKYGVRLSERAAQAALPEEPPGPDLPPDWSEAPETLEFPEVPETPETPSQGTFRIRRSSAKTALDPEEPVRTGGFRRRTQEPPRNAPDGGFSGAGTREYGPSPLRDGDTGPIPGTFGRSRGDREAQTDGGRSPRVDPGPRTSQPLRGLMDQLPPLWGVDLALILISLVGIIAILINLPAVLQALARMICSVIGFVLNLVLLLALVVALLYLLRRWFRGSRW